MHGLIAHFIAYLIVSNTHSVLFSFTFCIFFQYGMSRRALRNSVPDKKFEEMWDYTLRFLAGSEELEENTTYTNRDGVDLILPAKKSHAFKAASPKRSGGNAASNGSTGNAVLVQEEFIAEEGNKFFERLRIACTHVCSVQLCHAALCLLCDL